MVKAGALHVVLAGGGTGGHVIPAIAVAQEIVRRGGTVSFVGTARRLEAKLVPEAGFDIDFVEVRPLAAGGFLRSARALVSLPEAFARSALVLRRRRPDVVMGVGGYVAGPVVLTARLLGKPTALLEQNALVGMTNRLLSLFVLKAFVSYEATVPMFPKGVAVVTGNPVKSTILEASLSSVNKRPDGLVRILVMGGSQGAKSIDERVPRAMAAAGLAGRVKVLHQCGDRSEQAVRTAYTSAAIDASVVRFIDDTASAYAQADLVVARAGATTLSELTVMGLPAVLLPYPHHKDRQQHHNATPMRTSGAALVLDEKTTTIDDMAEAIRWFVSDDARRLQGARASAALGRRNATREVVDALFSLGGGG